MPAIKSPAVIPKLYTHQRKAVDWLNEAIHVRKQQGNLVIGSTGVGKMYVNAGFIKEALTTSFFKDRPLSLYPILYVTKATVVIQSTRVLKEFGLNPIGAGNILVTNYDQLRSKLGEQMIEEYTEIVHGEPIIKFRWKLNTTPWLIIWDECHSLQSEHSTQSRIAQALNDIEPERRQHIVQIFTSATPFGRVCEAKCFAVATRTKHKYGWISSELTNDHWLDFASHVAGDNCDYREHSKAACKRLVQALDTYIYTIKNVRPKFHAKNSTRIIQFQTAREAELYQIAFDEYQEKLRLAGRDELEGLAKIWVAQGKFREAAELIRAPYLAQAMFMAVQAGKAAVCAVNYRATVARITAILVEKYGVSREGISLIWGGISDVKELKENYQSLDLGNQSTKARQEEIDKFQSGESLYCIFTLRAGGVGLSLHHDKEHLRPREVFVTPVYNAKELVQGLGRCPRLTSRSDTVQTIVFYEGTIEEEVAAKVAVKFGCLEEVVQQKEDWSDALNVGVRIERPKDTDEEEDEEEDLESGIYIEDKEGEVIDI